MIKKYFFFILLFFVSTISSQNQKTTYQTLLNKPIRELSSEQRKSVLLCRLNELRAEQNKLHPNKKKLLPLKYNTKLEEACYYFFDHKKKFTESDGKLGEWMHFCDNGDDLFGRFEAVKVPWIKVLGPNPDDNNRFTSVISIGENLGDVTYHTMFEICEAWKNSPGHWIQIISPAHTHVGFGFRNEGDWIIIVTDFAKLE